jgi:acyl carrier protein
MEKLYSVVREALSLDQSVVLAPQTRLKELPGWDSMNSVNLEMAIETAYNVDRSAFDLNDDTTLDALAVRLG